MQQLGRGTVINMSKLWGPYLTKLYHRIWSSQSDRVGSWCRWRPNVAAPTLHLENMTPVWEVYQTIHHYLHEGKYFRKDGELCEFTLLYFCIFFWQARWGWLLLCFAYVAHFCISERCLDSNLECCRSKQARYQLSPPISLRWMLFLKKQNHLP